jgi:hypothetical protein
METAFPQIAGPWRTALVVVFAATAISRLVYKKSELLCHKTHSASQIIQDQDLIQFNRQQPILSLSA